MSSWDQSPLHKMSGEEFEVQEALVALRRLIDARSVRSTTRVVLEGAVMALENELEP